jgi:hypothetical protein
MVASDATSSADRCAWLWRFRLSQAPAGGWAPQVRLHDIARDRPATVILAGQAPGGDSPPDRHTSQTRIGERRLQAPLLTYLASCGWVRHDTLIVHELPWHGRHVDMVTRTREGSLTSYEFKLGSFSRVLEQAIYNRLSFDRSYVVVASMPRYQNVQLSELYSVGIIVVHQLYVECLLQSPPRRAEPALRARLDAKVLAIGALDV